MLSQEKKLILCKDNPFLMKEIDMALLIFYDM